MHFRFLKKLLKMQRPSDHSSTSSYFVQPLVSLVSGDPASYAAQPATCNHPLLRPALVRSCITACSDPKPTTYCMFLSLSIRHSHYIASIFYGRLFQTSAHKLAINRPLGNRLVFCGKKIFKLAICEI